MNLGRGGLFVEKNCRGDGDFIVHALLRLEGFHLVMQQRVLLPVLHARPAGDDDDRALFRVRAGDGVEDVQAADAVGHADQADAVEARIRVGGEAGAGLVGHGDRLDF